MADNRKHDDPLAGLLAHSLRPVSGEASAKDCPDAVTLAAYFDRSLTAAETALSENHFSICARCQEQLAALARSEPAANPPARESAGAPGQSFWNWRWLTPLAAALGVLVLWITVVPKQGTKAPADAPVLQSANRQPTAPPASGTLSGESATRAADAASSTSLAKAVPLKDASGRVFEADAQAGQRASAKPASGEELTAATGGEKAAAERNVEMARNATAAGAISPARPSADEGKGRDAAVQDKLAGRHEKAENFRRDADQKVAAADRAQRELKLDQSNQAQNVAPAANAMQQTPPPPAQKVPEVQNAQPNQAQVAQQTVQVTEAVTAPAEKEKQAARTSESRKMAAMKEPDANADLRKRQEDLYLMGRQEAASAFSIVTFRSNEANVVSTPAKNILWRFGPGSRIQRSTDGGTTWQNQPNPAKTEFLAASTPSDTVCWAVGRAGTILRTTDAGAIWEKLASPSRADVLSVVASDADHAIILVGGKRFSTSDGGRSWQSQ